jgi:hypothetical protein
MAGGDRPRPAVAGPPPGPPALRRLAAPAGSRGPGFGDRHVTRRLSLGTVMVLEPDHRPGTGMRRRDRHGPAGDSRAAARPTGHGGRAETTQPRPRPAVGSDAGCLSSSMSLTGAAAAQALRRRHRDRQSQARCQARQ